MVANSPLSTPLRKVASLSIDVSINTFIPTIEDFDRLESLVLLHQQAKFWANYNCKFVPWAFFVVKNGHLPTCDQMKQLRCSICFPHIALFVLIEKFKTRGRKRVIACNTFFGTSSMKSHVEYEHIELVSAYVEQLVIVDNILGSQVVGDEGCRTI